MLAGILNRPPTSMLLLRPRPNTSEVKFPRPAAAKEDNPKVTPRDASIDSPARIMMKLSMKPKPTIGTKLRAASRNN